MKPTLISINCVNGCGPVGKIHSHTAIDEIPRDFHFVCDSCNSIIARNKGTVSSINNLVYSDKNPPPDLDKLFRGTWVSGNKYQPPKQKIERHDDGK